MGIESQINKKIVFDVLLHMDLKGFNNIGKAVTRVKRQFMGLAESLHKTGQVEKELTRFTQFNENAQRTLAKTYDKTSIAARHSTQVARGVVNSQRGMAESSKNMKQQLERTGIVRMTQKMDSLGGVLGATHENWVAVNKNGARFNTMGGRLGNRVRLMTSGLKGFRMELLGIMFFGMMLQRAMFGMLRPAGEAIGLFELWTTTLQVFFLPIMLAMMPLLMSLMSWFMDAPDWLKLVIGGIVLFIGSLGALLFSYGAVSLGVGALIKDLSGLFALFKGFSISKAFKTMFVDGKIKDILSSPVMKTVTRSLSLIVSLVILYDWAKSTAEMMLDFNSTWTTRLMNVLQGTLGGALLGFSLTGGAAGALTGATIFFGITMSLAIADWVWDKGIDAKIGEIVDGFYSKVASAFDEKGKIYKFFVSLGTAGSALANAPRIGALEALRLLSGAGKKQDDFIWRSGQAPTPINSNDNLVGFKGAPPNLGGGGGGLNVDITNNIEVTDSLSIERQINDANDAMIAKLRDLVSASSTR